jgi:prevent-host-death family protein
METIAVREFRINPAKVWRKLKKTGRMIITSSGKPIALLTDIKDGNIVDEVRIDASVRGALAMSKLREHAFKAGISQMKPEEIEMEIQKSRQTAQ